MKNDTIEEVRISLNITKKAFAEQLGITQTTYTNYIKGVRSIPEPLALKMRDKYNISIDWLFTGEGKMKLSESEILLNDISKIESAFNSSIDPKLLDKIADSRKLQELIGLLEFAPEEFLEQVIKRLKEFKSLSKI